GVDVLVVEVAGGQVQVPGAAVQGHGLAADPALGHLGRLRVGGGLDDLHLGGVGRGGVVVQGPLQADAAAAGPRRHGHVLVVLGWRRRAVLDEVGEHGAADLDGVGVAAVGVVDLD